MLKNNERNRKKVNRFYDLISNTVHYLTQLKDYQRYSTANGEKHFVCFHTAELWLSNNMYKLHNNASALKFSSSVCRLTCQSHRNATVNKLLFSFFHLVTYIFFLLALRGHNKNNGKEMLPIHWCKNNFVQFILTSQFV